MKEKRKERKEEIKKETSDSRLPEGLYFMYTSATSLRVHFPNCYIYEKKKIFLKKNPLQDWRVIRK